MGFLRIKNYGNNKFLQSCLTDEKIRSGLDPNPLDPPYRVLPLLAHNNSSPLFEIASTHPDSTDACLHLVAVAVHTQCTCGQFSNFRTFSPCDNNKIVKVIIVIACLAF